MPSTGLNFGDVPIGSTVQLAVAFTNVGLASVTGSVAGGAAGPFGGSQNCQGVTIPVGGSCQVFYRFTPAIVGPITTTTTGSLNGQPFAFDFMGTGTGPEQALDLSPATISLASTATTSAVLRSAADFDATTVNVANVRLGGDQLRGERLPVLTPRRRLGVPRPRGHRHGRPAGGELHDNHRRRADDRREHSRREYGPETGRP